MLYPMMPDQSICSDSRARHEVLQRLVEFGLPEIFSFDWVLDRVEEAGETVK